MQPAHINDASSTPVTSGELHPAQQLKVLLSAYSCAPNLGSEPGVGWHSVMQTARLHEVWVLTAAEQRAAIEREMAIRPLPNVHWVFVEVPSWLIFWKKGERGRRIHYMLWQYWAYRAGKQLHQEIKFDIIHHVTFVSYWTPSYLAMLDAPFVWGPVGGGDGTPPAFYPILSPDSRNNELLRDVVRAIAHHVDPFVGVTARRSAIALPTTLETSNKIRSLGAPNIRIQHECALSTGDIANLSKVQVREDSTPFSLLSMGRLLGWKGYYLGIHAFAELLKTHPHSEYWLVGDGPERPRLEAMAQDLGISANVHFTGTIPRTETLRYLEHAHVLLHPSLHDTGSWVCLEAMAAGRPIVCLRRGGLTTLIDDATGFRVSADKPQQTIHDLAQALATIADDQDLRLRMGVAARERVNEHFSWDAKSKQFDKIYREVVKV